MSNMADLSNILANGVIFSTLKHTDLHTVRGRPTLKDGLCNERIFRNGSFRELKIAKESNDLAKVSLESNQKSKYQVPEYQSTRVPVPEYQRTENVDRVTEEHLLIKTMCLVIKL